MQSVIETLEGAVPSMLSRCSMRWKPPPPARWGTAGEVLPPAPESCYPPGAVVLPPARLERVSGMRRSYRQKRGRGW